jgi:peptide/nickel transport system substrate-binding protein
LRAQAQQLLQQNFQDVGIEMKIDNLPPVVMWGDYWMQSKFSTAIAGIDFMTDPAEPACGLGRSAMSPS